MSNSCRPRPFFAWQRGLWRTLLQILLLISAVLCLDDVARAEPPTLRIPRVSRAPRLEDFLNGVPREAEAVVADFRQNEPGDGIPASQQTAGYLSYDDKNLYVVFVCKDEPGKVRARLTKREAIWGDDIVGVILDTFHDRHRAYLFLANPLGIQLDGISTEGQDDDYSFDTLWHSEGRLTDAGYIVWMAIPFKSLRFPNGAGRSWGIALGRIIVRNNETSFWPYITERVAGFAQQLATLEGLEQVSPGRNVQLIPYGAFTRARFLDQQVPTFRTETEWRGGLDAKIVLRDALTLDVALNPDFSQVESDEPQVTVNRRFEVFFPEKRPFFIENAGFFQTRENLFFSRRIADPQFGVRLTGKVGRWAIGALAIDDQAPGKSVAATDRLHGRRAGIGVIRLQREFAEQSSIGLLVTSRDFASSSNRVLSLDTRLKLNPNWVLSGQVMRSCTRQLDGTGVSGPAYSVGLDRSGRHFYYYGGYLDRSPGFRSQLGFIPRVDIRQMEHFARYQWIPGRRRLVSYGPSVYTLVNWDRQGRVQDWVVNPAFRIELIGQTAIYVNRSEAYELFQDHGFRKHNTGISFSTEWLKWLTISSSYNQGSNVNFYPASGLVPFLAQSRNARLELTLRPVARLRFDQTYLFSRLSARTGSGQAVVTTTANVFNNHILRSKLNYQFTRELLLRAILDYNAVLPNPSLVALERAKRFTADILLTYLVNPGTAIYVGYTDNYENLALRSAISPNLQRTGSPTLSTGRQFFVKVSYLLRF